MTGQYGLGCGVGFMLMKAGTYLGEIALGVAYQQARLSTSTVSHDHKLF